MEGKEEEHLVSFEAKTERDIVRGTQVRMDVIDKRVKEDLRGFLSGGVAGRNRQRERMVA
jgi:hypothetical protein